MIRTVRWAGLTLLATVLLPTAAPSQVALGVQGSWSDDWRMGVGAQMRYNPGSPLGLEAVGTTELFLPDAPVDYHGRLGLAAGFVLPTPFVEGDPVRPFVRTGLAITHTYFDPPPTELGQRLGSRRSTEIEVPLHIGIRLPAVTLAPYVEYRTQPFEVYWWRGEYNVFTIGFTPF